MSVDRMTVTIDLNKFVIALTSTNHAQGLSARDAASLLHACADAIHVATPFCFCGASSRTIYVHLAKVLAEEMTRVTKEMEAT